SRQAMWVIATAWNHALACDAMSTTARSRPPARRASAFRRELIVPVVRPACGPVKATTRYSWPHSGRPVAKPNPAEELKVLARNKRARHEYHVDETLEAGLVLAGSEVKSIRAGKVTLVDAFADIDKGEAWLHQMDIGVYAFSHGRNHEPRRKRKLL